MALSHFPQFTDVDCMMPLPFSSNLILCKPCAISRSISPRHHYKSNNPHNVQWSLKLEVPFKVRIHNWMRFELIQQDGTITVVEMASIFPKHEYKTYYS